MTGTLDWMAQRITEIEHAAAEKERERIIKLLEGIAFGKHQAVMEKLDNLIALIKGEK